MWKICNRVEVEIRRSIPGVFMKQYWIDGATKNLEEILEEYRKARRRKRDQMWFLYIDLRRDFDEIERDLDRELNVAKQQRGNLRQEA